MICDIAIRLTSVVNVRCANRAFGDGKEVSRGAFFNWDDARRSPIVCVNGSKWPTAPSGLGGIGPIKKYRPPHPIYSEIEYINLYSTNAHIMERCETKHAFPTKRLFPVLNY